MIDDLILGFDRALRTLSGIAASGRANPAAGMPEPVLTADERRHAAGLMRVNHTGEVCAQALYQAQALTARDGAIRRRLAHAAREEEEHLAWTQQRLAELNDQVTTASGPAANDFAKVLILESSRYLRNQLLRDSDWAGMAHSLEIRVPLVDAVLTERIAGLAATGRFQFGKAAAVGLMMSLFGLIASFGYTWLSRKDIAA